MRRSVVAAGVFILVVTGVLAFAPIHAQSTQPPQVAAMDLSKEMEALKTELVAKHGEPHRARLEKGLKQVAALWRPSDGDFSAFVREQFVTDPKILDDTFKRLEAACEQLDGHFNEITRHLRTATDLDLGPLLPLDPLLSALDPSAHIVDDLFTAKIAFVALLNFPLSTLQQRLAEGKNWSRNQWAEARLTGRFARRVPAEVAQEIARVGAAADLYIAEYNIWMHHLVNAKGERLFPKNLRLISHWNLRDEIKADYKDPKGLDKQRLIVKVMDRIVTQSIPAVVINNPHVDWDPFTNKVTPTPAAELDDNPPPKPDVKLDSTPEPDNRYAWLFKQFKAARAADAHSPLTPNAIQRAFEVGREIPEERVMALFKEILASPLVPKVAAVIQKKLGRKLEPQDIWFNGFKSQGKYTETQLDEMTRKRYPTAKAFADDMPRILKDLGFSAENAQFLSSHIVVDASRGAGHAMQASRRGDFPRLRTRIEKDGMNYKGYNIAVHELGHNVEQVFSLYKIDHTLLMGVPNNAFTEALAFVFQARDLELLGLAKPDAEAEKMRVLNDFWQTWEIAGVAMVDVAIWHWMYEHPTATPAELREAAIKISREHWNKHYAPVLGGKDSTLVGIYSHMIAYPLYLSDYPLGHLIAFQIEEQVKKKPPLGPEFERMAVQGAIAPDLWMENASGKPVSAKPLLDATAAALK